MSREYENGSKNRNSKRPNPISNGPKRNHIPTGHRSSEFRFTGGIYRNDRSTRGNELNYSLAWWLRYRISIIFASTGAFGIGLAKMISELVGH